MRRKERGPFFLFSGVPENKKVFVLGVPENRFEGLHSKKAGG